MNNAMTIKGETFGAGVDSAELESLRAEFRKLRSNIHDATYEEWTAVVAEIVACRCKGRKPAPIDWVEAARVAATTCGRCSGSGVYSWGPCINGKPSHSGDCYRCGGKGVQDQDDHIRCSIYDRFAIVHAMRA